LFACLPAVGLLSVHCSGGGGGGTTKTTNIQQHGKMSKKPVRNLTFSHITKGF